MSQFMIDFLPAHFMASGILIIALLFIQHKMWEQINRLKREIIRLDKNDVVLSECMEKQVEFNTNQGMVNNLVQTRLEVLSNKVASQRQHLRSPTTHFKSTLNKKDTKH